MRVLERRLSLKSAEQERTSRELELSRKDQMRSRADAASRRARASQLVAADSSGSFARPYCLFCTPILLVLHIAIQLLTADSSPRP